MLNFHKQVALKALKHALNIDLNDLETFLKQKVPFKSKTESFSRNSEIKRRFDNEAAAEKLNTKLKTDLRDLQVEYEKKQNGRFYNDNIRYRFLIIYKL